jgi:hypothetical protein
MRLGVGRGPALAALLAAEPADPEEGVLLHGLAPTTVVAAPVLRQAAEDAAVAISDRHRSPCYSVAQRPLLNLLRSGGPVDVARLVIAAAVPPDGGRSRSRLRFQPPTARSVAWCSASIWSAPDGSGLLTLDGSSIWMDPDGSRRIVWMINRMIKQARGETGSSRTPRASLVVSTGSGPPRHRTQTSAGTSLDRQ